MNVSIFLLCYNESVLLPHTIKFYNKYLPSAKITIYDNMSTDNSAEIAKSLNCDVIFYDTNGKTNDGKLQSIKNECWKTVESGWIIVGDMDEYICVDEATLFHEKEKGTSILKVDGKNMIGESQTVDLTDIDLESIQRYNHNPYECKNICFLREKIVNINYSVGAHHCSPEGEVVYSEEVYTLKHMEYVGLMYLINKYKQRFNRSHEMRQQGMCTHYTDNESVVTSRYNNALNTSVYL
jgi:hypothetical protein